MLVSAGRFLKRVEDLFSLIHEDINKKEKLNKIGLIENLNRNESEFCYQVKNTLEKIEEAIEKRFMHVYVANSM